MSLASRLRNLFRGDSLTREIDEELQSHLDEAAVHGRDPAEARRSFGSALHYREESRDLRLIAWLDSLRADAVFGWRQLMKRKVTSAAAILSLGLAIGACTSAFRLIDALLLRPLPVAAPQRLYTVSFENIGATDQKIASYDSCSYPMFREMRAAVHDQAESVAVSYADRVDLTYGTDEQMEKAYLQFVSGWMFSTFGLRPALGRVLSENDDAKPGASPVAVLSFDYWSRRFARDPSVVGRTLRFLNTIFEIVGVSPEGFTGTETGTVTDVFLPMMMKNPVTLASAKNFWLRTLVQLKPGVSPQPVAEKMRAVHRRLLEERISQLTDAPPKRRAQYLQERFLLEPAPAGRSNLQRDYRRAVTALAILVAMVLLIACANVANLMTARAAARAREMALRVSIGAGRARLVQLVLVESAWLAFLATALGAVFAWWSAPLLIAAIDTPANPAHLVLPADGRVMLFGLALACTVTVLFGLLPALRASAVSPAAAIRGGEDPHTRRRTMHALIATQVAFCFVVQFVAGLFVTTFDRLSHQPTGFSSERILNLESLTPTPQPPAFWEQVAEHLRTVPGVDRVALSVWPVMSGESSVSYVSVNGAPPGEVFSDIFRVSPGWLEALRIPLIAGRDFRPGDSNPGVAVVNEAFARQYFNGEDPVGKSFETVQPSGARARMLIVGFVRNARSRDNMRLDIRPMAYLPFPQDLPVARGTFVVRTFTANPMALASTLRQEVPRARPGFRVSNIRTQAGIVEANTVRERLLAMLAIFFATVALLLSGIGLYGVLDYSVLERRREIGIRIAIGAGAAQVARGVTAAASAMVLLGAAAGIAIGALAARYVGSLLFEVKPADPTMLVLPLGLILASALLAALPAVVRAIRIDPAFMLRSE